LVINNEKLERIAGLIKVLFFNRRFRREIVKYQIKKINLEPKVLIQIEGSFDSSYSLAIVNREIARALNKIYPNKVSLYSTDGYGDFKPSKKFLKNNPDIEKMNKLSEKFLHAPIVLRNPYPPRVHDMKGLINAMTSYGWEESEYPKEYLEKFNLYLDVLPVMSPYVKKVMIDNGIKIPVEVVGIGVDHILSIKPRVYPLKTKKNFKFLHISSCFPRKGIDVLLDAYTSTFSKDDDVVLIIKTFPNPHNEVEKLIEYYQNKYKKFPEIELINKDISDEEIVYLYTISDCFILPSRGEGFGMPAAEAMLFKKPVIATNFSGQTYFCKEDTAILVDFFFEKSKSHMNLPFSFWATPKKEELRKKMIYVMENIHSEEIQKKVEKAYHLVKNNFTWDNVAKKLLNVIHNIDKRPIFERKKIKLAWISSWNSKCGIASYSKFLINNFSEDIEVIKIANKLDEGEILDKENEKNTHRVWNLGAVKDISKIVETIKSSNIDAIVIQHHFAFFETKTFGKLINKLKKELSAPIFITLHSTKNNNKKQELSLISDELNSVERVFVHSIKDLNIMKNYGVIKNLSLIPQGIQIKEIDIEISEKLKKTYKLEGKRVIGTFGFLRKHKGILELIEAFSKLKSAFPELTLFLLTSLYPSEDSREFFNECSRFINNLPENIKKDIIFITEYIPEDEVHYYINLIDIVIFPYHDVNESSSSAVRYALSLKKPIVISPAKIFEDIEDVAIKMKGYSPKDIENTLKKILINPKILNEKKSEIINFVDFIRWEKIAERFENIIKHFV